jgi:hypothetical protein
MSTEMLPPHHFCLVHRVGKTANINGKKLQFSASCKDSRMLQESWTYKTAKNFSRTRHVRSGSVYVLTNASKVLGTHFLHYYVSDTGLSGE